MHGDKLQAILLAAGKSTRFNTSLTKLSFTICGQEMIAYPLRVLANLGIRTTLVVGYQKDVVLDIVEKYGYNIEYIEQTAQKGTGHAVLCTRDFWSADTILILNGDVPLLKEEHITAVIERHQTTDATITFATACNADPSVIGYGRVIEENGSIAIVEQRDFKGDPTIQHRLNAGIYAIKRSFLERELPNLPASPFGEVYITDLIKKASESKERIELIDLPFDYVRGINTLKELWMAEHIKKSDIILHWMQHGVRFAAPQSVHIDLDVTLGADSFIGYGVQLRNATRIGQNVHVDAFSIIDNALIHDEVIIHSHSVISNAEVHTASQIGPFAHVHKETILHPQSVVGNFVEVSKSSLGMKSKVKHLSYLGNAQVGTQVNIGAGAITCNYNGVAKHTTTIKDHAFIGTNASLIAPVTIGEGAIVAAGSAISKDVPDAALAIARAHQINKEQYAPVLKKRYMSVHSPSEHSPSEHSPSAQPPSDRPVTAQASESCSTSGQSTNEYVPSQCFTNDGSTNHGSANDSSANDCCSNDRSTSKCCSTSAPHTHQKPQFPESL